MPSVHPWAHTVGQQRNVDILKQVRGIACGGATETKTTAMARPGAVDA